MRKFLFASGAIAPLCAAAFGAPVFAQTVISNERTTPVQTSTVNNGAPGDVRVAAGGTVRPSAGTAVTIDSNNGLINEGTIEVRGSNGAVGVLVQGGRTGSVLNRGTISINEDYTPADADNDGDADGPFAQGSGRYGIRVTGASPFTGPIGSEVGGGILVEGNDSFGVSIETGVTGAVSLLGGATVVGDRSTGVSVAGPVTGNLSIGQVNATGGGAVGVSVTGPVGGRLTLNSGVSATGYRTINRPSDVSRLDADDLLQGGPAVRIAGDIAGGIVIDRPPADLSATDPDEDDDGVNDASEVIATVRSFGSAPALLVGAAGRDVTVGATAPGEASLLIRGNIGASGVYDGVTATAVQIGGAGFGGSRLTGGINLQGAMDATAAKADATALRLGAGAVAPSITLGGTSNATTTGGTGAARVVLIEQGAVADTLRVTGRVQAAVSGAVSDAIAIEDRSGRLGQVENTGTIAAGRSVGAADGAVTGRSVAIDLAANTAGALVRQLGVNDGDDGKDNAADPDADSDGVDDGDEPAIFGDVLLGSGADTLELLNGTLTGAVSFGAGADRLLIDGTGRLTGSITDSDGRLAVDIRRGTLELSNSQPLNLTSLDVGANGALIISVNPAGGAAAALQVAGAAQFVSGAKLGVRLTSLIDQPQTFTLLQAGALSAPGLQSQTLTDTPYLFVAQLGVDEAADRLTLNVRRRTAAEAGLNRAETGAFDAVYAALNQDAAIRTAFLAQNTEAGFTSLYRQLLPEHSGGTLYALASGSRALSSALTEGEASTTGGRGAWLQEVGYRVERERGEDAGFEGGGFGVMGGVDVPALGGAVGLTAAFLTAKIEDDAATLSESVNTTALEAGAYWRATFGGFSAAARGSVGWASMESTRGLEFGTLSRTADADWSGLTAAGHVQLSYRLGAGRFHLRPEAALDGFLLREGSHDESGGGAGFDLIVDERTSELVTASTLMNFGVRFGGGFNVGSELSLGWRQILSGGAGETTARFGSSGTPFTIQAADAPEGAAVVGLNLSGQSEWSFASLQARAEAGEDYSAAELRVNLKFLF